ncbi:MAG TPA: exopolyphosphatase [Mariprofundaceae bacterium]|nr:exopolyphosphatase [Mariprofundaceae bacterium]
MAFWKHDRLTGEVAAVDLGSSSFHMIVARVQEGQPLLILDRLREMVRLREGLDADNNITPEVQERALACLQRFGQRLKGLPPSNVRVVGTNTLRHAEKAHGFLQEAEKALGHPIQVISGDEEARLIYLGVARSLGFDEQKRLVIDIGGGSTECIIGQGLETRDRESLAMGCVSYTRRFFADGGIHKKAYKEAEIAALRELQEIIRRFTSLGWQAAVGAAGTIRAVAQIAGQCGWSSDGVITREAVDLLRKRMLEFDRIDALDIPGLSSERKLVFPGGLAVLRAAFKALNIDRMTAADGGLREGVLYDLLGRNDQEDMREQTVRGMKGRYLVDEVHAGYVNDVAARLFQQACDDRWPLGDGEWGLYLSWAATLHEAGLAVSHSQYHKHGAYLLANSDMSGFSQREQRLLAFLVGSHRRKLNLSDLQALSEAERKPALRLCVLLRLAVLLTRNRIPNYLPDFSVAAGNERIALQFPDGWLDEHPLTRVDLEQERGLLQPAGVVLAFS